MTEEKKPLLNYDQLYPGRFLKAGHFCGKKPTLTIADIENEELIDPSDPEGKKRQVKAILSFRETGMKLVLCKTNGQCLKGMFGKVLADWKGKRVTLYAGEWKGEEAIRVWGSPDIDGDKSVTIKLARRRDSQMTMHCTAKSAATAMPTEAAISA